jgi:hypothetical protein
MWLDTASKWAGIANCVSSTLIGALMLIQEGQQNSSASMARVPPLFIAWAGTALASAALIAYGLRSHSRRHRTLPRVPRKHKAASVRRGKG